MVGYTDKVFARMKIRRENELKGHEVITKVKTSGKYNFWF